MIGNLTSRQLMLYVYEVELQCRYARYRLDDALELERLIRAYPVFVLEPGQRWEAGYEDHELRLALYGERHQRIHLAIHDFLIHAANVNKVFFPLKYSPDDQKGDKKELLKARMDRGEAVRNLFDLQISEPFMPLEVRNDLEHFDERLDVWCREGRDLGIYDLNAMPFGAPSTNFPPPPSEGLRNLDGDGHYRFRGHTINLKVLRQELQDIQLTARVLLEQRL